MVPFNLQKLQKIIARSTALVEHILVRDEPSRTALDLAQANPPVTAHLDVALALLNRQRWPLRQQHDQSGKLAVAARKWGNYQRGSNEITAQTLSKLITNYLDQDANRSVVFASTCQGIPHYWVNDSQFAKDILQLIPNRLHSRIDLREEEMSLETYLNLLRNCDAYVSMRMHGVLMALAAGVPALSIAYEFKSTEIMKRLGLDRWSFNSEDLGQQNLLPALEELLGDPDSYWGAAKLDNLDRAVGYEIAKSVIQKALQIR